LRKSVVVLTRTRMDTCSDFPKPDISGSPRSSAILWPTPRCPPLIPVGKSTWWAGVKDGRYPKPVKLGPRITAWRVEDVRALIVELAG